MKRPEFKSSKRVLEGKAKFLLPESKGKTFSFVLEIYILMFINKYVTA